jgi:hypothetical protein
VSPKFDAVLAFGVLCRVGLTLNVTLGGTNSIAQYLEPVFTANKGKSREEAPHVFVVAHGIFNSELLGALLARRPASAPRLEWRYSGMTNTGWTRVEIAFEDEGLIRPDRMPSVVESQPQSNGSTSNPAAEAMSGGGGAATTPDASSIPSSPPRLKRIVSGGAFSKSRSPPANGCRNGGPPPPLLLTIVATNVTTHLDGLKRQQGGIGSAPHDSNQKDIRSYFGGS